MTKERTERAAESCKITRPEHHDTNHVKEGVGQWQG